MPGRGEVRTRADLAARSGLCSVRVSNILCLLRLHPSILEYIERIPAGVPERLLTERWLRPFTKLPHAEQLAAVSERLALGRLWG